MPFTHLLSALACAFPSAATTGEPSRPSVVGIELDVTDVDATKRFYVEALGFAEDARVSCSRERVLTLGDVWVALRGVERVNERASESGWSIDLRVRDLAGAVDRVIRAGGRVPDSAPKKFPLGQSVRALDPAGHVLYLVDVTREGWPAMTRDVEPFDVDADVTDVARAETWFDTLGFAASNRAYLPGALPLERLGATQIVIHAAAKSPTDAPGERLLLGVPTLEPELDALRAKHAFDAPTPLSSGALGRSVRVRGADGLEIRILERSPARIAFERLRGLQGNWIGTSTKGWSETTRLSVIAGGSTVLDSSADAHPGEAMATLFTMDGAELALTHYCVAGNAPRLVARRFEDDGRTVTFEFTGGANLASRDVGHMDSVILRFVGDDEFRSVWSWYQDGRTSWMEEIRYERADGAAGLRAR